MGQTGASGWAVSTRVNGLDTKDTYGANITGPVFTSMAAVAGCPAHRAVVFGGCGGGDDGPPLVQAC